MTTIDTLLCKHADHYRFHGAGDFLSTLIAQSENGDIRLWGRNHDGAVDGEEECEWNQGKGYLYCTDINGMEVCANDFGGQDNLILVLERIVDNPQEWFPRSADQRERLVLVEEYKVIGGIRPVPDDDGDIIDQEAFSLEEILEGNF